MLNIESVNHVGIRVSDPDRAIAFYDRLGFVLMQDAGFENRQPIIMSHPSGVIINLLGPATVIEDTNVLMDIDEKHTGITHFALTVSDLGAAKRFLADHDIPITGSFSFGNMSAVFIRDPDRNVIELDAYVGNEETEGGDDAAHP